jgi:uncharacterized protein YegL
MTTWDSAAPPGGATSARIRTYLIYIVLDTSASMRQPVRGQERHGAPLDHFVKLIPRMLHRLASNPLINNMASVSVVGFNDRPEILRRMTSLEQAMAIASPRPGGGTDYAAVLEFLAGQHRLDVRDVNLSRAKENLTVDVARPWVFFITDGLPYAHRADQPRETWMAPREKLVGKIGARIVSIGLPGADQDVLWELATGDGGDRRNAFISDRHRTNPSELAQSVVDAIQKSVSMSAGTGLLTIDEPVGMRRIEGRRRARA